MVAAVVGGAVVAAVVGGAVVAAVVGGAVVAAVVGGAVVAAVVGGAAVVACVIADVVVAMGPLPAWGGGLVTTRPSDSWTFNRGTMLRTSILFPTSTDKT